MLVGYGTFEKDEFIRLVTINVQNESKDILNFFQVLEDFVESNKELFMVDSL
jgi:sulfinoalanine decarboxylase/sulfinoalanine decarboxylase/aspartate 1-decarboxylase